MNFLKKIFFSVLILNLSFLSNAKAIPESFADLAEKLMPSVVYISTTQTIKTTGRQFPFQFPPGSPFGEMFKDFENNQPSERQASALGSGFIIKEDGIVITNNHVIKDAEDILVKIGTKEYKAKVIGADPYMDIAVLKMETNDKFKAVKFGDSDKARVGDWVVAIGNPFGLGGTVTSGIISARNRDINLTRYDDFIQTDASINQGNSGGPLFNLEGEVIGINTAIIAPGQSGSIGIGFAIPANAASNVIDQLINFGETRRGWLGVRIQMVSQEIADSLGMKEAMGALVADVNEKSPAKKAGIKNGDVILEFNGIKIDTMRKLPKVVGEAPVGKVATIKIWRNKKIISKKIVLGRLEETAEFKKKKIPVKALDTSLKSLGVSVRDLTDKDLSTRKLKEKRGVLIKKIDINSPLSNKSVRTGDIIISLQNKKIKNVSDFKNKLKNEIKSGNKNLLLTILDSKSRSRYVGVKIK